MREEIVKITCDICGEEVHGDYLQVLVGDDEYTFHLPRIAALRDCGNKIVAGFDALVERLKNK